MGSSLKNDQSAVQPCKLRRLLEKKNPEVCKVLLRLLCGKLFTCSPWVHNRVQKSRAKVVGRQYFLLHLVIVAVVVAAGVVFFTQVRLFLNFISAVNHWEACCEIVIAEFNVSSYSVVHV